MPHPAPFDSPPAYASETALKASASLSIPVALPPTQPEEAAIVISDLVLEATEGREKLLNKLGNSMEGRAAWTLWGEKKAATRK